jgi:arylsulfatase A-like enzyme
MSQQNVVYITIDSLRADHVGHLGYDRETTPTLDRLAEDGTVCSHAIANGIPTFYSFKSLLGGVSSFGHSRGIGMPPQTTTVAEAFRDRGYETAGINAGNPWLTRDYGYQRGFDTFRDFLTDDADDGGADALRSQVSSATRRLRTLAESNEFVKDKAGRLARTFCAFTDRTPLEDAETVTELAVEWLQRRGDPDRPFFLWIHYMDPHYPWVPQERYMREFCDDSVSTFETARLWHNVSSLNKSAGGSSRVPDEDVRRIRDLYDAEIRRTDDSIRRILDTLKQTDDFDDTVVSVVGDHGTELYDHGGFSHGPRTLYDEIIHVPLLFAGDTVPNERLTDVTSLLDVVPTLLDVANVDDPVESDFVGRSVYDTSRTAAVTEVVYDFEPISGDNSDNDALVSCVDLPWKLIVNRELGTRELYHLERDPRERENVADDEPETVAALESTLEQYDESVDRQNNTLHEKGRVRSRVRELKQSGAI